MQFSPVIDLIVWINYSECFEGRISDRHILDSKDGFYCSHLYVLPARNATDLMQVVDFFRFDAILSTSCIKSVVFIKLNQVCKNHT